MKTLETWQKTIIVMTAFVCLTALLVVGLWNNKYAGSYVAWILLSSFFIWQYFSQAKR